MGLFRRKKKDKSKEAKAQSKTPGKKTKLTKKQLAQRKYAGAMRGVRSRALKTKGGSGRIGDRRAAQKLRSKLGIKKPKKKTRSRR